jgi:hypothetical protein
MGIVAAIIIGVLIVIPILLCREQQLAVEHLTDTVAYTKPNHFNDSDVWIVYS